MLAKFAGKCAKCGKPIAVGEVISWSRQERGKIYHTGCKTVAIGDIETRDGRVIKDAVVSPLNASAAKMLAKGVDPSVVGLVEAAPILAELLKKLTALTPAAPAEPEPEETDYAEPAIEVVEKFGKAVPVVKLDDNAAWYDVFRAIVPVLNRILLIGPPSTGKSTTAMILASIKHRITMTETTSREDLIGMFHLIDGATKWVDGPFTLAMRNGAAVLLDEIDRYSPECASLLYSLIDDKPHISLPTGELVEAQPGYRVIMTTNENIETLPVAVQDRIEATVSAATPHPDSVKHLPKPAQDVVMGYYKGLPVAPVQLRPSVRRMRAFHTLLSASIPPKLAAELVFGKQGAPEVLSALTSAEGN